MSESYDVIIVGAGLAGACAAFHLSRRYRVLILEADRPAAGASGVAAGMANPLMSRRARPVWRMPEAMEALQQILDQAGAADLSRREGILRPALSEEQADDFRRVAEELPGEACWLTAAEVEERHPHVRAPLGALWGENAITVRIPHMIDALLHAALENGAELRTGSVLMGWGKGAAEVEVQKVQRRPRIEEVEPQRRWNEATQARETPHTRETPQAREDDLPHRRQNEPPQGRESIPYRRALLLCLGREYKDFDALRQLRLHQIKGQLVRVARPPELAGLPHVGGRGYVMAESDRFLLGSTYEHSFCDLRPDAAKTREIIQDAADVVPALADAEVLEAWAAVRVTVPGIRLPMVGPVPGEEGVWVFTGLGSRGLMMAPMVAHGLPEYLENPGAIPREIRVRLSRNS